MPAAFPIGVDLLAGFRGFVFLLQGHYWTDRNTAGEMRLTDRRKEKFQDFVSAQAHYAQ